MDWMELLNQCLSVILPAIASVVAIIFGVIGAKIKTTYDEKRKDETTKAVVDNVVKFVQQVYKDLNGADKLQKALTEASAILNEKGITVSETELNMLIESAVYGLKQGITTTVNNSTTTTTQIPESIDNKEVTTTTTTTTETTK